MRENKGDNYFPKTMDERTRFVVCMIVAALLIIGGTLATGLLPSEPLYPGIAGAIIVIGFAVPLVCFGRKMFSEIRGEQP